MSKINKMKKKKNLINWRVFISGEEHRGETDDFELFVRVVKFDGLWKLQYRGRLVKELIEHGAYTTLAAAKAAAQKDLDETIALEREISRQIDESERNDR